MSTRRGGSRLALILTEFPPAVGGMQTHAESLACALRDAGHDICVYTYRCDDARLEEEAQAFDREANYPVHRVLSRVGFWANHHLLGRLLRQQRPALIYASNVYYGLLGPAIGVPVVCRSAGNDVQRPWIAYPYRTASRLLSHPAIERRLHAWYRRWNAPEWLEAMFRRHRQALVRRSVKANRLILANSRYTSELLSGAGATDAQVRVLPGGVDVRRFRPCADTRADVRRDWDVADDTVVVLTVCRLVAKKGIDFLMAQVPALLTIAPRLRLVIVGDGKERGRCQAQVDRAGLADTVRFVGKVPQREVQRCFAGADVFVLASRVTTNRVSGMQDAETMGRVLCEANAAGVPVIASRSGGIPSVVTHEDNGLLFKSDDAADFLAQFTRLQADASLRARLVARGRERAEREFSWPHLIDAHLRCFEQFRIQNQGIEREAGNADAAAEY